MLKTIRDLAGCSALAALAALALSSSATAQTTPSPVAMSVPTAAPTRPPQPPAPPEAVSVDAIIRSLYAAVSHPPNQEPDWAIMRAIFLPAARLIPPARPNGEFTFLSAEEFITRVSKGIATRREQGKETGFSEREISRKTDCFGNVCQLFSTYESRYTAADLKPFARGINAIQLVRDGNRWWIVNVLWDQEAPDKPIPAGYLTGKN